MASGMIEFLPTNVAGMIAQAHGVIMHEHYAASAKFGFGGVRIRGTLASFSFSILAVLIRDDYYDIRAPYGLLGQIIFLSAIMPRPNQATLLWTKFPIDNATARELVMGCNFARTRGPSLRDLRLVQGVNRSQMYPHSPCFTPGQASIFPSRILG